MGDRSTAHHRLTHEALLCELEAPVGNAHAALDRATPGQTLTAKPRIAAAKGCHGKQDEYKISFTARHCCTLARHRAQRAGPSVFGCPERVQGACEGLKTRINVLIGCLRWFENGVRLRHAAALCFRDEPTPDCEERPGVCVLLAVRRAECCCCSAASFHCLPSGNQDGTRNGTVLQWCAISSTKNRLQVVATATKRECSIQAPESPAAEVDANGLLLE